MRTSRSRELRPTERIRIELPRRIAESHGTGFPDDWTAPVASKTEGESRRPVADHHVPECHKCVLPPLVKDPVILSHACWDVHNTMQLQGLNPIITPKWKNLWTSCWRFWAPVVWFKWLNYFPRVRRMTSCYTYCTITSKCTHPDMPFLLLWQTSQKRI